ncbi:hypothetical protein PAXRUDRAFT_26576 [Paxillus rubicundulus Ve08.2h10]|uniref:Uncharacterized protein n=1 Tax=Paxillus rubicundulus Ve08.2h10 TaxID=930991 RepID=A0A0D0E5L9_9AGAM|nr:hypothetical protein PAXRUDRAFT_26576 [Paxillus rubicundulus Ve08.2h10]
MDIAGPSRARPGRLALRRPIETTYGEDLLGFLQGLSIGELEGLQTLYDTRWRHGHALRDHDIAMKVLSQQTQRKTFLNNDRALAQCLAAEEGTAVDPGVYQVNAAPQPNPAQDLQRLEVQQELLNAAQRLDGTPLNSDSLASNLEITPDNIRDGDDGFAPRSVG